MKKRKKKIIKIVAGIVVVAIFAGVVIGSQNQGTAAESSDCKSDSAGSAYHSGG